MATGMSIHSLWSNSNTKDILVTYAEGLACDNLIRNNITMCIANLLSHG